MANRNETFIQSRHCNRIIGMRMQAGEDIRACLMQCAVNDKARLRDHTATGDECSIVIDLQQVGGSDFTPTQTQWVDEKMCRLAGNSGGNVIPHKLVIKRFRTFQIHLTAS